MMPGDLEALLRYRMSQAYETLRDPAQSGSAILTWMVRGCLDWQSEGLRPPEAVRKASRANRAEMNPLGDYIHDTNVEHPSRVDPDVQSVSGE